MHAASYLLNDENCSIMLSTYHFGHYDSRKPQLVVCTTVVLLFGRVFLRARIAQKNWWYFIVEYILWVTCRAFTIAIISARAVDCSMKSV